jgi:ribonuclease R
MNGRVFKLGMRVRVLLDRIDRQQRRLQFALMPGEGVAEVARGMGSLRGPKKGKASVGEDGRVVHTSPDRSGRARKSKGGKTKAKARLRDKKSKGKRR